MEEFHPTPLINKADISGACCGAHRAWLFFFFFFFAFWCCRKFFSEIFKPLKDQIIYSWALKKNSWTMATQTLRSYFESVCVCVCVCVRGGGWLTSGSKWGLKILFLSNSLACKFSKKWGEPPVLLRGLFKNKIIYAYEQFKRHFGQIDIPLIYLR